MSRIAYFGPQGTFTEQAAISLSTALPATPSEGDVAELIPVDTVVGALAGVRAAAFDAACVPVESSVEGAVNATMDALSIGDPLVAVAETVLPVRFSVLVRPGTTAADVRTVASYPHALAQVRDWLAANLPGVPTLATTSTAAAAVAVAAGEVDAAITAPVAARHYPLTELATDVADIPDARTRFLLVCRPGVLPPPTGVDRTSLVAVTPNRPGALAGVLVEIAERGIDLSRIESRPIKGRLGEYRFFFDLDGHIAEERVGDALAALRRRCISVRFLGSFPRADGRPPVPAPGSSDEDFLAAQRWLADLRSGRAT